MLVHFNIYNGLLQLFFLCDLHGFAIWDAQIGIWDGVLYAETLGGTFNVMVCVPFAFNVNILTPTKILSPNLKQSR